MGNQSSRAGGKKAEEASAENGQQAHRHVKFERLLGKN